MVVSLRDCKARLGDFAVDDLIRWAFWFGDGAGEAAAAAAATSAQAGRPRLCGRVEGTGGGAAGAAEASGDGDGDAGAGAGAEAVDPGFHPKVSKLLSLRLSLRLLACGFVLFVR